MSDTFWGYKIPVSADGLRSSVRLFNHGGNDCWGSCVDCTGMLCRSCIFNGRYRSNHAVAAFAMYAKSLGLDVTRTGAFDNVTDDGRYRCEYCGNPVENNNNQLCDKCYGLVSEGELHRCVICGAYSEDENTTEDSVGPFCDDCYNRFYTCDSCGDVYRYDDSVTCVGDETLCNTCFREAGYRVCDCCGETVHADDAYYSNGDVLCESCYDSHESCINDYSFRPSPIFKSTGKDGAKPIYLGFELEAGDADSEYDRDDVAETVIGRSDLIYLKADSSIPDYGFEMVTHPMTFWYHKDHMPYKEILQDMIDGGMLSHNASESCGLHVHVNRNALSADRWILVDWFIHRHKEQWEAIARRKNEWYAKFKTRDDDESLKDGYDRNDRYRAINFCNRNTIEFRLFRGSLKYDTVIGTLCLVDAVVTWARTIKMTSIIHNGAWKSFVDFLTTDSKYDDAVAYLKDRELL